MIAAGTSLVDELLSDWSKRTLNPVAAPLDGEDITMAEKDGGDVIQMEYAMLKNCVEEYRERLEANEWTRKVLEVTY